MVYNCVILVGLEDNVHHELKDLVELHINFPEQQKRHYSVETTVSTVLKLCAK